MTFHFPDEVDVNIITIDATDPKSGTAEFKADRRAHRQVVTSSLFAAAGG